MQTILMSDKRITPVQLTSADVCRFTFEKCIPHITNFTTAIDVGCRYGDFTRPIVEYFDHCHSFDYRMTGFMQALLAEPVGKKITYYETGLSDKEETATAWGGVIVEHREGHVNDSKKMKARLRTMDSYGIQDVGFIKIDVEGHELMVLRGALNTIERNNPVICIEQNDATEKWDKGRKFEALDFLKDIGYEVVDTRKWDYIMVRK